MRRKFTTAEVFLLFVGLPILILLMIGCVVGLVYFGVNA